METEFITPDKRRRVKTAFEALNTGWSFHSIRKDTRTNTWKLALAPQDESAENMEVVLGVAELDGIVDGGPAGERAVEKIRRTLRIPKFRQTP